MSASVRLLELLDRHAAKYEVLPRPPDSPVEHGAEPIRLPSRDLARVAVIRHGGTHSIAVLPARARVDLERLGAALHDEVELAPDPEIAAAFPDCEIGAMPPFGMLYGLKTYLDESLTHGRQLTFTAGSHTEAIRMAFDDYRRIAAPIVLWFAESPAETER